MRFEWCCPVKQCEKIVHMRHHPIFQAYHCTQVPKNTFLPQTKVHWLCTDHSLPFQLFQFSPKDHGLGTKLRFRVSGCNTLLVCWVSYYSKYFLMYSFLLQFHFPTYVKYSMKTNVSTLSALCRYIFRIRAVTQTDYFLFLIIFTCSIFLPN